MPQFAVYENPRGSSDYAPYLTDIQSDLLALDTRVVIPMAHAAYIENRITRLNPIYEIESQQVVLATTEIVGMVAADLTTPVTDLSARRDEIMAAVDLLLMGF